MIPAQKELCKKGLKILNYSILETIQLVNNWLKLDQLFIQEISH